jgi:hypothetical protein
MARRLIAGERVSASSVSVKMREILRPLLTAGLIKLDSSARGEVFVCTEAGLLLKWMHRNYPVSTGQFSADAVGGKHLILSRDTKCRQRGERELALLFRGFEGATLSRNGVCVPIAEMTKQHGVAAVALFPEDVFELSGTCAMVENADVFWRFSRAHGLPEDLVLLKSGRAPAAMLSWMKRCADARFVLHVDYDPVGLDEYRRCREAVGSRVSLHLPPDLALRFAHFSNESLLAPESSLALLAEQRKDPDPAIRSVIALMDIHHAGLEHEALLIDCSQKTDC